MHRLRRISLCTRVGRWETSVSNLVAALRADGSLAGTWGRFWGATAAYPEALRGVTGIARIGASTGAFVANLI